MVMSNYRPTREDRQEKKRGSSLKWILLGMLLLGIGAAIAAVVYETQTSKYQAREISRYAATLTYDLKPGPSETVIYPKKGPFDTRLGYARLPQMLDRVQARGMTVEYQTKFSPALADYVSQGFFTPYPEKTQAGLSVADCRGSLSTSSATPGAPTPILSRCPILSRSPCSLLRTGSC